VNLPDGTTIDYIIDGQNRRIGKKVNGVLVEGFLYRNQLQPAAWLNADGSTRATFVYRLCPNVPAYMVLSGVTYRFITDQVGSVRLVVNTATAAVVERIDWDEFGNVLADSAPGFQPFGFAGGLRDVDTGLVRFGTRDYDPRTGRWTAKDLLRFGGALTNLYNYVAGDPVNFIDPTGLYFDEATLTPEIRRALSRLEANPEIGWEDHNDPNSGPFWVRRIASNANAVYFENVMRDSGPFRTHH